MSDISCPEKTAGNLSREAFKAQLRNITTN
jgi:hypothetical protein